MELGLTVIEKAQGEFLGCVCMRGLPPPSPPPQEPPATLHIHHCGVRPWGALVTMKVNSEIAPRPRCRLFKLWYKPPPPHRHLPPPPPYIGCKLQRRVKYIHYTDGHITRRACVCACQHVRVQRMDGLQWGRIRNGFLPSDVEFTGLITQPPFSAYCKR